MKLAAIDILIIAAYMAVIVYIAWRSRRFDVRSEEETSQSRQSERLPAAPLGEPAGGSWPGAFRVCQD